MKHLKLFEELQDKPQIGDYIYVDVKDNFGLPKEQIEDAKTRTFKIVDRQDNRIGINIVYTIKAVPESGRKNYNDWYLFDNNVLCFAPTIEELKLKYQTQKYNL
jgi:hypothetical protein